MAEIKGDRGRPVRSLPFDQWPELDQAAWSSAIRPESVFEDGGLAAGWASATIKGVRWAYGSWLLHLRSTQSLGTAISPADRVTGVAVRGYAQHLLDTTSVVSAAAYLNALARGLSVMLPREDYRWVKAIAERLRQKRTPIRIKEPLIVSTDDLIDLGISLVTTSGCGSDDITLEQARQYRDGLMIALLAARPLRKKNFLALIVGETFAEHGGQFWLIFDRDSVKNRENIRQPVPDYLNAPLRRYLEFVRPFLLGELGARRLAGTTRAAGNHLWISGKGGPVSDMAFYDMVCDRTLEKFGHSISPHLFRDCFATTQATVDPAHTQLIRAVLGHKTLRTSEKYYDHAQGAEAIKRVQAHVQALRRPDEKKVVAVNRCGNGKGKKRS